MDRPPYSVILGTIRGNFGDESVHMLLALLVFAAAITIFVKSNHLEEKYGLAGWPKDMKKYLFFIPMWILATGNIWGGFAPSCRGTALIVSVSSMALVGYVEEMIFRGFLFRAMLAGNTTIVAITVTAMTFIFFSQGLLKFSPLGGFFLVVLKEENNSSLFFDYFFFFGVVLVIWLCFFFLKKRRKKKKGFMTRIVSRM